MLESNSAPPQNQSLVLLYSVKKQSKCYCLVVVIEFCDHVTARQNQGTSYMEIFTKGFGTNLYWNFWYLLSLKKQ
jgi:hypothetical protein